MASGGTMIVFGMYAYMDGFLVLGIEHGSSIK